ncbi:MAG TPA: hypothetical protein VMJ10_13020 [Kofleriaceae bacterium]|nr:hypothetical protein [Kofleriaceae bacterium]
MEDREAAARAIADAAKRTRKPLPRGLWIASLVVAVVCTVALAIGYLFSDPKPDARRPTPEPPTSNGFTIGLVIGLGSGIAIGSVMALRTRKRD